MLGIGIEFELGRYHATPWGTHVNSAEAEWPPSPWRILRAAYAISRTNLELESDRDQIDSSLAKLAGAAAPVFEMPPTIPAHTRHYFPARSHSAASPSTDKVIDAFLAVDNASELKVWWDLDMKGPERDALDRLFERVPYLGRSESVCRVRLLPDSTPAEVSALPADLSDDDEGELIDLLCVDSADPLAALGESVKDIRRRRATFPSGASPRAYRVRAPRPGGSTRRSPEPRPEIVRFRVVSSTRPGIREAVTVANHVRKAAQSRYGELTGGCSSATLSGRSGDDKREDQHSHAHYLALTGRDGRRIDHLVVWALEGLGPEDVAALQRIDSLRMRDREPLRLVMVNLGSRDELRLPRLLGPSRRWRSVTPFALVRHPKTRGGKPTDTPVEQVRAELMIRGIESELSSIQPIKGAWAGFKRHRPGSSLGRAPAALGFELEFKQEVRGPLCLGALSHFGLGLFEAID